MNDSEHSTHDDAAAQRAEAGTAGWEDAARLQLAATPDHADFYALAGEMVQTLHSLENLVRVMHGQVAGYVHGRKVYDDTRQRDPRHRLAEAVADLDIFADRLRSAERAANAFWSGIGHIGVEVTR